MRSDAAIMVGVVGGTLDRVVLGWAAEEATARHADLLVCHVRERGEPRPPTAGEREPAGSAELLVREAASTVRTWFPDLAVTTAVGDDRVVASLLRASLDARMLVLGADSDGRGPGGRARGSGGFERLRIGSVSQDVLRQAQCAVVIAR